MAVIQEGIRLEPDNTLSFGDYETKSKRKVDNFEVFGDVYKVKTYNEITRLEKNAKLLIETVPGAAVHHLYVSEKTVTFNIEGFEDTQVTMELEPSKEYNIMIDEIVVGSVQSHFSGKINFSVDLCEKSQNVKIEKAP